MTVPTDLKISLFEIAFKDLNIQPPLIGSRAIGCARADSDFDYIVNAQELQQIKEYLNENNIHYNQNNSNNSLKIRVTLLNTEVFFIINIVPIQASEDYKAWIKATEIMKIIPNKINYTKAQRIALFCAIVKGLGGFAPNYPNLSS